MAKEAGMRSTKLGLTPEIRDKVKRLVLVDGWKISQLEKHIGFSDDTIRRLLRDAYTFPNEAH